MSVDEELIDRFLDGEVSKNEEAEVIEWLEPSANLEHFVRRAELHADLRSSLRRRSIQKSAIEVCEGNDAAADRSLFGHAHGVRQRPVRLALGIAVVTIATAVCLLIAFMMQLDEGQPESSHEQLATVVTEIDALLTHGESTWNRVDLVAGDYQLRRGLLHLRFDGGVMVYVEAPAQFDVVSGKHLALHNGRLSASVPAEGIGFTVNTPEAEVVDFGTEFSVEVGFGTSEVHVFDGLVRVQPKSTQGGMKQAAVDLRTSQAVKINDATEKPVDIELATDRFIRSFDEPRLRYPRVVNRLSPLAFYRMPIRDRGLVAQPPKYSGVVLTEMTSKDKGLRPPHARGVTNGGSLRVLADSTGRGGRVDTPLPLVTHQFTLAAFVYLEASKRPDVGMGHTVATNLSGSRGNFALVIDEHGFLQAAVRTKDGDVKTATSEVLFPLTTWCHLIVTCDGHKLQLYENGQLVASSPTELLAESDADTLWFGTDSEGQRLWNGRIDELAIFDRALTDAEIVELSKAALE